MSSRKAQKAPESATLEPMTTRPDLPPPAAELPSLVPDEEPQPRLDALREYAGSDGLVPLRVLVSHDALFAGAAVRMPPSDRIAGLVEKGFLDLDLPEPGFGGV